MALVNPELIKPLDTPYQHELFEKRLENIEIFQDLVILHPSDVPSDILDILNTYNDWAYQNTRALEEYQIKNSNLLTFETPLSRAKKRLQNKLPELVKEDPLTLYECIYELFELSELHGYYTPTLPELNKKGFEIINSKNVKYVPKSPFVNIMPFLELARLSRNGEKIYVDYDKDLVPYIYVLHEGPLNLYFTYVAAKGVLERETTEENKVITDWAINRAAKNINEYLTHYDTMNSKDIFSISENHT